MPATKRGVYHNLKESKYTVSNLEIVFFFSSELYLIKFMETYKQNRKTYRNKFRKSDNTDLNFDTLYDILLYKSIESRGFHATLNGVSINQKSLEQYSLRKMTEINSPEWCRIERPKIKDRIGEIYGQEKTAKKE